MASLQPPAERAGARRRGVAGRLARLRRRRLHHRRRHRARPRRRVRHGDRRPRSARSRRRVGGQVARHRRDVHAPSTSAATSLSATAQARDRLAAFSAGQRRHAPPGRPTADDIDASAHGHGARPVPRSSSAARFTTLNGVDRVRHGRGRRRHRCRPALGRQPTIRDAGTSGGDHAPDAPTATRSTARATPSAPVQLRGHLRGGSQHRRASTGSTTATATPTTRCPSGQVLYTVSHAHNCSMHRRASRRQTRGRSTCGTRWRSPTYPTGHNVGPDDYGWNYAGLPASSLLQWFPTCRIGSYTGQSQAAWSLSRQRQLRRAGRRVPDRQRHRPAGPGPVRRAQPSRPTSVARCQRQLRRRRRPSQSVAGQVARVAGRPAYDMDNKTLTYNVYRSGTTAPDLHDDPGLQVLDLPEHGVRRHRPDARGRPTPTRSR